MYQDEFDCINIISRGAGSTVYKVVHRPTGKLFALKVICGHYEHNILSQIFREIETLREVENLNVVKCHDMFHQAGEIKTLLEYMDGGSLEGTHIINESSLADITRQVLSGLYYLHKQKIDHSDIKPSNLLVNSQKQVKIANLGVSRILAQYQTMNVCNPAVGAIGYMSPDRINPDPSHGNYDGYAGDIWSLGMSILEFYLGRFPFTEGNGRDWDWNSLMCVICKSQPPKAPATTSREFRDFIACCLQKDPARRWTAVQLLRHPFVLHNTGGNHHCSNQVTHQILPPPPHPHFSSSS